MGAVYKAQQLSMDKPVALKVLPANLAEEEKQVQRFKQEGLTSSQLKHPNTIRVIDYGQSADGFLYLAMELLEGTELQNVIKKGGEVEPARAIKIARQVCKSIGEAHEMGLVHRDLKPGNIFLCDFFGEKDFVKVLDFGIAKFMEEQPGQESLTQTGFICGTPLYIAPEQALGRPVSPATDIYSLGVILYEMLCGQPPFRAETPIAIVMRHIHDQPPPMQQYLPTLSLPPEVEQLVFQMVAKDPRQRPASAHEVGLALEDILSSGILRPGAVADQPRRIRMPTKPPETKSERSGSFADLNTRNVSDSFPHLPELESGELLSPSQPLSGETPLAGTAAETGIDTGSVVASSSSKRPPWMWAAVALVVIGLAAGGVVVATGGSDTSASAQPNAVQTDPAATKAAEAEAAKKKAAEDKRKADEEKLRKEKEAAAKAEAAILRIPMMSNPPEVEVTQGSKLLGNTPVTVELSPTTPALTFTLRKPGFKPRDIELDYNVLMKTADPAAPMTVSLEADAPVQPAKTDPPPEAVVDKKNGKKKRPVKKKKKKKKRRDWGSSW